MPLMQTAMGPLNQRFSAGNVGNQTLNPVDAFAEGNHLSDLAQEQEYFDVRDVQAFLRKMPLGVHEAIRAVIRANLQRDHPLPITFAWQPGYDWEVTISDIASTDQSEGGITILVRSRYPGDPHPLEQPTQSGA